MTQLVAVARRAVPEGAERERFPFTVPVIRALDRLDLDAPVVFFVGENGSGKSTLLEGIAAAAGLPAIGSADVARDHTLAPQRRLGAALRLTWRRRSHRGFYLRAEDFFGFTKRLAEERVELQRRLAELEEEYRRQERAPYALGLAQGPLRASLSGMEARYGIDLDANSHGESFLRLFRSRFVPGGLYLLDEPEAPLSPQSQLALLVMLGDMVEQGAQFIIATHSPLLLAHPGARIYSFDDVPPRETPYDALDHVTIVRDFLNHPDRWLRRLREPRRDDETAP